MIACKYRGVWSQSGWRYLWLMPVLIGLDQLSKHLVWSYIPLYHVQQWLPMLNVVHVHNYGAAFSFMNHVGGVQRYLFAVLAMVIAVVLLYVLRRMSAKPRFMPLALLCVISGALGNAIDRMIHGFVVDFIDFHWLGYHWPAFNVADSLICIGVVCLLYLEIFFHQKN
jgi:signal peptidase II